MKIERPRGPQQTSKVSKTNKPQEAEASFEAFVTSSTQENAGAQATQSIAKVDALLAVQAVEDPTERSARKKMRQRADNILQELDKIKVALSLGTLTVGHVINIADVVATHREKFTDPGLAAIMDEIDLRAQIEIAKMRMSFKNKDNSSI